MYVSGPGLTRQLYEVIDKLHFAQARLLLRGNRNQFGFCTAPFASWSLRSSRQRLYFSAFAVSGSSWRFNQKSNQSTVACCETSRSHGFSRMCVPCGREISFTGFLRRDQPPNPSPPPNKGP